MNVVAFGGSGLIGRGVLHQALASQHVNSVLSIGRRELPIEHPKLRQIVHKDFEDFAPIADELANLDACFWCLGTASAGMDESSYTRITYDFTMAAARVLVERSPDLCFCFVSGSGTSTSSRMMWARVKGKTEDALGGVGFRKVVLFRPAFIQSTKGEDLRGSAARAVFSVVYPVLRSLGGATSNGAIGDAMIAAAMGKAESKILNSTDINRVADRLAGSAS